MSNSRWNLVILLYFIGITALPGRGQAQHKLNLTESCSGTRLTFCTLYNVTSSLDDPLEIVNSSAIQLEELIILNADVANITLPRLPRELFMQAPILRTLILYNTRIQKLQSEDFVNGHQLRKLALNRNRLYNLGEKIFISLFELEELQIARSQLVAINEHAFNGLRQLRRLDLQLNTIKMLPINTFNDLLELEYVDLSGNLIETMSSDIFATNSRLQHIILSGNQFKVFQPNTFQHLQHLRLLDVSNCQIVELQLQSIDTLIAFNAQLEDCHINGSLITMRASKNQLSSLNVTDKLSIRELDLGQNQFTTLEFFNNMENLEILDLSENSLSELITLNSRSSLYLTLPSLRILNLAHNALTQLNNEIFLQMPKLRQLNLAYNQLNKLNRQIFNPLYALEKLYLEGNQLQWLDYRSILASNLYLREVNLWGNPWLSSSFLQNMTRILQQHRILMINNNYTIQDNDVVQSGVEARSKHWHRSDVLGLIALLLLSIVIAIQVMSLWKRKRQTSSWGRYNEHSNPFIATQLSLSEEADSEI